MNTLCLPLALLEDILAHAADAAPEECVGLLFGHSAQVSRVLSLANLSQTPQTRFFAAPQELFAALKEADGRGEQLLGSYHSHPQSSAWPSSADLAAAQAGAVQLIVGQDAVRAFQVQRGIEAELELKLQ